MSIYKNGVSDFNSLLGGNIFNGYTQDNFGPKDNKSCLLNVRILTLLGGDI